MQNGVVYSCNLISSSSPGVATRRCVLAFHSTVTFSSHRFSLSPSATAVTFIFTSLVSLLCHSPSSSHIFVSVNSSFPLPEAGEEVPNSSSIFRLFDKSGTTRTLILPIPMGAEDPTAQRTPPEVTEENVDALLEAARYDDMDDVVSLASIGVPLDSKDSQGRTALHMAAANGHLDIVDYLISRGVDVNSSNEEKNTPLHWACLNGHIEVVKKLILSGANVGVLNSYERTPMDEAVSRGKLQVMDAINEAVTQLELTGTSVSA